MTVEEHLIAILAEEGVEVSHQCCKALRFGMGDVYVDTTVEEKLVGELNDLIAVADMLAARGLIRRNWACSKLQAAKVMKVTEFLKYSRAAGTRGRTHRSAATTTATNDSYRNPAPC